MNDEALMDVKMGVYNEGNLALETFSAHWNFWFAL